MKVGQFNITELCLAGILDFGYIYIYIYIYILNCRSSNAKRNKINLAMLAAIEWKLFKFQDGGWPPHRILEFVIGAYIYIYIYIYS